MIGRPSQLKFYSSHMIFTVFMLLASGTSFAKARDLLMVRLPDLPVIPGASWQWVGKQMVLSGTPMSIKIFEYKGTEKQLEQFYVGLWKSKGLGEYKVNDLGRYKMIGHELDGFYATVQYKQEGGVIKGKLAVTQQSAGRRAKKKTKVPKPPSSKVMSHIQSLDQGVRSETVTIESDKAVGYNTRYYENQYKHDDWSLIYSRGKKSVLSVRHFQKGPQLVQITIKHLPGSPQKKSHIIVHWIK